MNATELVPTLETCRALWDAGVRIETCFVRVFDPNDEGEALVVLNNEFAYESSGLNPLPAPTFAELWAVMPMTVRAESAVYDLRVGKYESGGGWANYFDYEGEDYLEEIMDKRDTTEALALLLLELIQAGHVRPENLNVT